MQTICTSHGRMPGRRARFLVYQGLLGPQKWPDMEEALTTVYLSSRWQQVLRRRYRLRGVPLGSPEADNRPLFRWGEGYAVAQLLRGLHVQTPPVFSWLAMDALNFMAIDPDIERPKEHLQDLARSYAFAGQRRRVVSYRAIPSPVEWITGISARAAGVLPPANS